MAVFFSNMYIFAPGISIAKKSKLIAVISIIAAIMNAILNYALIPVLGLSGAAYATLISAVSAFSLYIIFSYKYYPIPYQVKPILLSFVITLVSSYGVASIFDKIEFVSIIVKIICLLVVLMSTSFFLLEKKYLQKIKLKLKMRRK
jgi:O-antigen/teichoic acid export membrane protein